MLGCRVAKTDTYVPSLNFLPQGNPHFSIIAFNHPLVVFLFVLGLDFGSNPPNSSAEVFRVRLYIDHVISYPCPYARAVKGPIQDMPSLSELGPPATPELLLRRHPRSAQNRLPTPGLRLKSGNSAVEEAVNHQFYCTWNP